MSKDHQDPEAEYFHKMEKEKLAALREKAEAERLIAEAQALRDLHYMCCGKCGNPMTTEVFKGMEIEICSACGAVLLDPGELETLAGADGSGAIAFIGELFSFRKKKS